MKRVTRIDRIRASLKTHGPMTAVQVAEKTGISAKNVNGLISIFRQDPGKKTMIRKAGKNREGNSTLSYVYELSNEPDADYASITPPLGPKRIKYPGMDREEVIHQIRMKALAKKIRPFRDPFISAFFGEPNRVYPPTLSENRGPGN